MKSLLLAIVFLAPHLREGPAELYAKTIYMEARRQALDPLLVAAIIHIESRWSSLHRSRTGDWGLTQVHVGPASPRFLDRENLLLNPRINIREGVRILKMWQAYHQRTCLLRRRERHPFYFHFKWGRRVRPHKDKVGPLYRLLKEKFSGGES